MMHGQTKIKSKVIHLSVILVVVNDEVVLEDRLGCHWQEFRSRDKKKTNMFISVRIYVKTKVWKKAWLRYLKNVFAIAEQLFISLKLKDRKTFIAQIAHASFTR